VEVFAEGLENPRIIKVAPNGNVYVTDREAGRVALLRDTNGDGRSRTIFARGLRNTIGFAWHPVNGRRRGRGEHQCRRGAQAGRPLLRGAERGRRPV
jgi:glucose/arabinose dehydrogenase